MDLERIAAVIRPRSPWEAIDLGYTLVRAWWRPIFGAWMVTVLPTTIVVLTLFHRSPVWAYLILWWWKPLFDRVPLFVVSRALFGDVPRVATTARATPRLWLGHPLPALFLYRFDLARSFNLPVWQLERLRGRARRQRAQVLQKQGREQASWLTFACWSMDWMVLLALFGLVTLMLPEEVELDLLTPLDTYFEGQAPLWFHALVGGLSFAATAIVEPFYVAGGFALYLDRRVHLEGWDVELTFRRLAQRIAAERATRSPGSTRGGNAGSRAAMGLVLLCLLVPGNVQATPPTAPGHPQEEDGIREGATSRPHTPAQAIRQVLLQPEFDTRETVRRWRLRGAHENRQAPPDVDLPGFPLANAIAVVLEGLLWLAVLVAAVGLVLFTIRRGGGLFERNPPALRESPQVLFGLDVRAESLPEDVSGTAQELWEKGRFADALSLLYRATLAALVVQEDVPVQESWTEGDCLRHLGQGLSRVRASYFTRLTRAWQSVAYAHRTPGKSEFQELCRSWSLHFGEAR